VIKEAAAVFWPKQRPPFSRGATSAVVALAVLQLQLLPGETPRHSASSPTGAPAGRTRHHHLGDAVFNLHCNQPVTCYMLHATLYMLHAHAKHMLHAHAQTTNIHAHAHALVMHMHMRIPPHDKARGRTDERGPRSLTTKWSRVADGGSAGRSLRVEPASRGPPHSRPLPVRTIIGGAKPRKKTSRVQGTSGALRQSRQRTCSAATIEWLLCQLLIDAGTPVRQPSACP